MAHCQQNDGIGEQILPNPIDTRPPRIKNPPPSHPFQFLSTSQQNTHHTRRQIRPTHDIYPHTSRKSPERPPSKTKYSSHSLALILDNTKKPSEQFTNKSSVPPQTMHLLLGILH